MNNPNDEVHANKLGAIANSISKLNNSIGIVNELLEEITKESHETEIIAEIWEHYDKGAKMMLLIDKYSNKTEDRSG